MQPDPDDAVRGAPSPRVTLSAGADERGRHLFFAALSSSPVPMVVTDPNRPDDPIVFANRAFGRLTGYDEAAVVGRNCRFLQGTDSDPATVDDVRLAIRARTEITVEMLNYRKDGTAFWNELSVSPVFDADGELVYFFATQGDVTRRREGEAARRAQDGGSVGALVGSIAHEFNNLLQVIAGHMDGLDRHAASAGDARLVRRVGAVSEAAARARHLTQRLLALSRHPTEEARRVDGWGGRDSGGRDLAQAEADEEPEATRGPGGRILVVDDRAEVAELARAMLEEAGFAVEVARDAEQALARLQPGFDLLFTDLVMPGALDGMRLAQEAQRRHPGLRVLLTTGNADPAMGWADHGGTGFDTIAKPYRRADLTRTVRRVLDAPVRIV